MNHIRGHKLGGSWVVINGVISRVTRLITHMGVSENRDPNAVR